MLIAECSARKLASAFGRCSEKPDVLVRIRTLARKRNVVGMDLTEYSYVEGQNASAFLCAKLIYKTLAFVFEKETTKVRGQSAKS